MMITLNCGWGLPGEGREEENPAVRSLNAAFDIEWIPAKPENDNLPEYLYVVV
jgi:hypothetical protein